MKKLLVCLMIFFCHWPLQAQMLYLRPELGIAPIASAEGEQYLGHYTGLSAGIDAELLFGELGIGYSSSERVEDDEISRTSFQITGGLIPDDLFRFSASYYPLVKGHSQFDSKSYLGSGFGLSMSWRPLPTISLKGEYRYHGIEEENSPSAETINFSEFMLSISYLFYR